MISGQDMQVENLLVFIEVTISNWVITMAVVHAAETYYETDNGSHDCQNEKEHCTLTVFASKKRIVVPIHILPRQRINFIEHSTECPAQM
mmetsp:Transcript_28305/g.51595  ORF Transcript_28305/g.51595 Transcript_28305/m.51595 type:complete len:90 (-) Transcript_28305:189-458(-)